MKVRDGQTFNEILTRHSLVTAYANIRAIDYDKAVQNLLDVAPTYYKQKVAPVSSLMVVLV